MSSHTSIEQKKNR